MGKAVSTPPSGSFTTVGALLENNGERTKYAGTLTSDNVLTGGDLIISVVASDPYTGQAVRLDNIRVESSIGTLVTGIPADGLFELSCPSYENFVKRITTGISAKPISKGVTVQNQSLPDPVKIRDSVDSFSNSPGTVCRQFTENAKKAAKNLGLIHERDDIATLQGRQNGRSPGVVVSQGTGTVNLFSHDGKQNMGFEPNQGLKVKAASVDMGGATQEVVTMQYGSLPQMVNPMNPMVPQGTIVMPQPFTIPNMQKILNFVATTVDMIELTKACAEAVKAIRNKDQIAKDNVIKKSEGAGTFEESVNGKVTT